MRKQRQVVKAHAFLAQVTAELERRGIKLPVSSTPQVLCQSIEEVSGLVAAERGWANLDV